jgi:hypothetical protein
MTEDTEILKQILEELRTMNKRLGYMVSQLEAVANR